MTPQTPSAAWCAWQRETLLQERRSSWTTARALTAAATQRAAAAASGDARRVRPVLLPLPLPSLRLTCPLCEAESGWIRMDYSAEEAVCEELHSRWGGLGNACQSSPALELCLLLPLLLLLPLPHLQLACPAGRRVVGRRGGARRRGRAQRHGSALAAARAHTPSHADWRCSSTLTASPR